MAEKEAPPGTAPAQQTWTEHETETIEVEVDDTVIPPLLSCFVMRERLTQCLTQLADDPDDTV
jgi:hypothetical protein